MIRFLYSGNISILSKWKPIDLSKFAFSNSRQPRKKAKEGKIECRINQMPIKKMHAFERGAPSLTMRLVLFEEVNQFDWRLVPMFIRNEDQVMSKQLTE